MYNFFSKVMESFVLDSIRSEISLSNKQYGGIKGCGVNNLLVDMRNHILTGLDEEESAVTLMAVDFSKAFNRMSHQHCLAALARKGCPTETIKMVYSFLQGRVMYGYEMSRPRGVNGGSPQGTKLGNLLFCLTVEGIHESWNETLPEELSPIREIRQEEEMGEAEEQDESSAQLAIPEEHRRSDLSSTPCLNSELNSNLFNASQGTRNKINVIRDTVHDKSIGLPSRDRGVWTLMYVDDLNIGEVQDISTAICHYTTEKEQKLLHARKCEKIFKTININAGNIGMRINAEKTQLLSISDCPYNTVKSFIYTREEDRTESEQEMKILLFSSTKETWFEG